MNTAHASHSASPGAGVASWYTPGRSDGFGDRLLMFDNTDAVSLELLRFRPELATALGFESALRDRVDHLAQFHHPAFPAIRAVVHLDDQDLTLVSAHVGGQRLSELPIWKLRTGLHPAVVTWLIREVTPALAALQAVAGPMAHGVLSTDRILLNSEGRIGIVEYAIGPAVRRLDLTPAIYWRQFGLLAPADDRGLVRIDPRTDVIQLGAIALSLLLARPVTLVDFDGRLPALLDEFDALAAASPSTFATPLRAWLERALQLAPHSYESAADAREGAHELPSPMRTGAGFGYSIRRSAANAPDEGEAPVLRDAGSRRHLAAAPLRPRIVHDRTPAVLSDGAVTVVPAADDAPVTPEDDAGHLVDASRHDAEEPAGIGLTTAAAPIRRTRRYGLWIATALGAIALGEAVIIATLGAPPAVVSVAAPLPSASSAKPFEAPAVPAEPAAAPRESRDRSANAIALAAARQRSGGLRLTSPIELHVLEGDRVLGSTADGPIVASAGTHEFDLVNAALGYRTRQTVTITAGVIHTLTVPAPVGRININAQPWAQVLIDGRPVGETPLANVVVPLGQHAITFHHPQLGERTETITVRGDTNARVTTSFDP